MRVSATALILDGRPSVQAERRSQPRGGLEVALVGDEAGEAGAENGRLGGEPAERLDRLVQPDPAGLRA